MKENLRYRRKNRRKSTQIEALNIAQKIVFAPFTFQIIGTMIDLGLFKVLDDKFLTKPEIINELHISEYMANIILQAGFYSGILRKENNKFTLSKLGKCFLHDEMTLKNYNFMREVCYLGASELTNSLNKSQPCGLQKFLVNDKTIYPHVPELDEKIKKSWYEFDHFYSDDSFKEVLKIIFKKQTSHIFDIGGNTGKFELAVLNYNTQCSIDIVDLPVNKDIALKNTNSERVGFIPFDVLSGNEFPKMYDTIFMSQFLDCFSFEQVVQILEGIKVSVPRNTRIFILEPLIDNQVFESASFSLSHISMYFTCMANGNSKMFMISEITELINKAGLKLKQVHLNLGPHCYTLLECEKE